MSSVSFAYFTHFSNLNISRTKTDICKRSGAKNCSAKMEQVQEGGGEERKETLADKPLDFENHPHTQ